MTIVICSSDCLKSFTKNKKYTFISSNERIPYDGYVEKNDSGQKHYMSLDFMRKNFILMEENKMIGIVDKPQFDVNMFQVKSCVKVKKVKSWVDLPYDFNEYCLITKSTPLEIQFVYIRERGDDPDIISTSIKVEDVVNGSIEISLV